LLFASLSRNEPGFGKLKIPSERKTCGRFLLEVKNASVSLIAATVRIASKVDLPFRTRRKFPGYRVHNYQMQSLFPLYALHRLAYLHHSYFLRAGVLGLQR
jgi:cytochrome b561